MVYVFDDAESDENIFGHLRHILLELLNLEHKEIFYNMVVLISRLGKVVLSSDFGQRHILGRLIQ